MAPYNTAELSVCHGEVGTEVNESAHASATERIAWVDFRARDGQCFPTSWWWKGSLFHGRDRLATFFENIGWKVFTVPETATILLGGRVKFEELNCDQAYLFQKDLLKTMLQIEDVGRRLVVKAKLAMTGLLSMGKCLSATPAALPQYHVHCVLSSQTSDGMTTDERRPNMRRPVFTGHVGPSISSTRFVPSPLSSKMFSSFVSDVDEVLEPYLAELSAGPSV
ncbi:hypothetical protein RB195_024659 [Necator americanus]|uniref:Uncharacterized protein n=1 Tax=Necator americanus TaxID=51031 RepID=A0ABR1EP36_NECAM